MQENALFRGAFAAVSKLVRAFDKHRAAHLDPAYTEVRARGDYLDKFFTALGWDVAHDVQKNPFEQEVRVENNVKIEGRQRRADYAFYLSPNFRDVQFYAEAKKPAKSIASADNYFQALRYGWNSGTPIVLLTDFATFHVLDCRSKPNIDHALQTRVLVFQATDLLEEENFAKLYFLFSREAVARSSLRRFADSLPGKRKAKARAVSVVNVQSSIDDAFLEELDRHREALAKAFKNKNPELDGATLTEIVQRTIDRLVFLRFLEDKLIETEESVSRLAEKREGAWHDFTASCRRLDSIYNGIIFKKHPVLDSPQFAADEKVFGEVCRALSQEHSPYNFDAVPIHILGSIYERFLGKVIVTTDKRAKVELKPELRKSGGVYYTPEVVVRDIVARTVGKLIDGKTPAQIGTMQFADIACGSGSFLLGVYELLLAYHRRWYNENPRKAKPTECITLDDGSLRLTLQKKREILLNNVWGVDIDPQAIEVAQLSLYLKLLEEETTSTARNYQLELHQTLLPSLSRNLVCGNSLVDGRGFGYEGFDEAELRRINPLDFAAAFPHIAKSKGFDAIVGNPPYVNAWELFASQPLLRDYLTSLYKTADRHWDLYVLFVERAMELLKDGGRLGYIIPYSYCIQKYAELSRQWLLENFTIESVADVRRVMVFRDVPVITIIPTIVKKKPAPRQAIEVLLPDVDEGYSVKGFIRSHKTPRKVLLKSRESMLRLDLSNEVVSMIEKIEAAAVRLGDICYVNYGAQMSSRKKGEFGKNHVVRESKASPTCRPMISGRELYRHEVIWEGRYVEWALAAQMYGPRWPEFFELPKLMVRDLTGTHRLEVAYDDSGYYCDHTVLCALRNVDVAQWKPVDTLDASSKYDLRYIAGVVGSTVVSAHSYWVLSGEGVRAGGGFHTYPETIRAFPIPELTASNASQAKTIATLVDRLMDSKRRARVAKSEAERSFLLKQAAAHDLRIDALVAEMFGLTSAEIAATDAAVNTPETVGAA